MAPCAGICCVAPAGGACGAGRGGEGACVGGLVTSIGWGGFCPAAGGVVPAGGGTAAGMPPGAAGCAATGGCAPGACAPGAPTPGGGGGAAGCPGGPGGPGGGGAAPCAGGAETCAPQLIQNWLLPPVSWPQLGQIIRHLLVWSLDVQLPGELFGFLVQLVELLRRLVALLEYGQGLLAYQFLVDRLVVERLVHDGVVDGRELLHEL